MDLALFFLFSTSGCPCSFITLVVCTLSVAHFLHFNSPPDTCDRGLGTIKLMWVSPSGPVHLRKLALH